MILRRTPLRQKRLEPRRKGKPTPRIKPGRVGNPKHLAWIASLPCCVCGARPVEVHHIRDGQVGTGQRAGDDETIPLCPAHHRLGPDAFHSAPRSWEERFGTQREHLARILGSAKS